VKLGFLNQNLAKPKHWVSEFLIQTTEFHWKYSEINAWSGQLFWLIKEYLVVPGLQYRKEHQEGYWKGHKSHDFWFHKKHCTYMEAGVMSFMAHCTYKVQLKIGLMKTVRNNLDLRLETRGYALHCVNISSFYTGFRSWNTFQNQILRVIIKRNLKIDFSTYFF